MQKLNKNPTISAVVIACNEEATIEAAINSIRKQSYGQIMEIIVIEGNSTDNTVDLVRKLQEEDKRIRLVSEDSQRLNPGPSPARRLGVELAKAEYVWLLNGDISLGPNYIASLMVFAQNNNLSGTAGLRWIKPASVLEDFVNIHYWLSYFANQDEIKNPQYLSSDAALYKRADLLKIGNFDSELICGEDADLGYRLIAEGKKLGYLKSSLIFHKGKHYRTLGSYLSQRRWYARGSAQLAYKYPFRYAAEQNKVHKFIIRPLRNLTLWLILTLVTAWSFWPLALFIQLWPLRAMLNLGYKGAQTYKQISQAQTPTRIRLVCCWLWPIFDWLSYFWFTLFYISYAKSADALYRNYLKEPLYSETIKAANIHLFRPNSFPQSGSRR